MKKVEMVKTKINGKYELVLPNYRALRPEWNIENGGWEVKRIESMLSNLTDGDIVLDIGTEEADMSALLAQKAGNIIMVEPNPKVWPNIKAIFEANNLKPPMAYFVGFASNKTDLTKDNEEYKNDWPECANGDMIGDHGFKELAFEGDSIPQIQIDRLMKTLSQGDFALGPNLITIDVEGSEFEVLKGAEETIRKFKPHIYVSVHPEFMFRMFRQYTAELVNFVEALGYKHEILEFAHEYHFYFKPL